MTPLQPWLAELHLADGRWIYTLGVPAFIGTVDTIVWEGRVFVLEHSAKPASGPNAVYRERFAWFAPRAGEA